VDAGGRQARRCGNRREPGLFYMHCWVVDDAVTLAVALRPALDATNLQSV
jgi:hypothetical protein